MRRHLPWLVYVATLVSALPLGAILAAANPMPSGACSGIGWGCSLYGWDAVGLMAFLYGIPYAAVLGVAILVPHVRRPESRAALVVALTGLVALWVAGLAFAGALTPPA